MAIVARVSNVAPVPLVVFFLYHFLIFVVNASYVSILFIFMHRIYILNLITKCYLDLVCKGKIGHACCPFLFKFKIKSCLNSEVGERYKVTYSTRVSEKEIFIIRVELIFLGYLNILESNFQLIRIHRLTSSHIKLCSFSEILARQRANVIHLYQ